MPGSSIRITPAQDKKLFKAYFSQGMTVVQAADTAGMSRRSAHSRIQQWKLARQGVDTPTTGGRPSDMSHQGNWIEQSMQREVTDHAIPFDLLPGEAQRAIGHGIPEGDWDGLTTSFLLFRTRYCGHPSTPWQKDAARIIIEAYYSPYREYLVINVFPGSGKSTLLTDLAAWFITRDRRVRGLFGSRSTPLAEKNTRRVRRLLERLTPAKAPEDEILTGLSCDAATTLALDFGRFKPIQGDVWRSHEFVVEQMDGLPIEEKEATLAAFGFEQEYLGHRFNFAFWDDVDSLKRMGAEVIEKNREIFDREAEPRVEAGGLVVVCQQRLGPHDFSAYCLTKKRVNDDDDSEEPIYRHIIFKAHYEDICQSDHALDSSPWPNGCMLEPRRLPWRDIRTLLQRGTWATVYQQEDVDPSNVLVPELWIQGGQGADGVEYPGCLDKSRSACEIPDGLASPTISVVTADPSPTMYWSVQWWLYNKPSELRYLLDLERKKMDAPDFLDHDPRTSSYSGLLEDWWQRSKALGRPFTHLIVEKNAAQRFMLQYRFFKQWCSLRGVLLIPHETTGNKLDPEYGIVASLKPVYRHGRVRLPATSGLHRLTTTDTLIREVTRWPDGATDDCVMAQWFFEYHIPRITPINMDDWPRLKVPSWLKGASQSTRHALAPRVSA